MPAVSGSNRQGTRTVLDLGDMVSGYTEQGVLVTGKVTQVVTDPAGVVIEGITGYGGDIRRGTYTVPMRGVLTSVPSPRRG